MIDLKPEIRQALLNNAALVLLLGGKKVWPQVAPEKMRENGQEVSVVEPYITFFEITSFDTSFANNVSIGDSIHFQVDIWTKGNTGAIASEVDKTMKEMGFSRSGSKDMYEQETKTYHKVLRYKTIKYGS